MRKGFPLPLIIAIIFGIGLLSVWLIYKQFPFDAFHDPKLPISIETSPSPKSSPALAEIKPGANLVIALYNTIYSGQHLSGKLINSSRINYYAFSGRFGCTIYGLEMKDAGSWKDVSSCPLGSPVGKITIVPGETPFAIESLGMACFKEPCNGLSKGTYHFNLTYSDNPNFTSTKTIYSTEFEIR